MNIEEGRARKKALRKRYCELMTKAKAEGITDAEAAEFHILSREWAEISIEIGE